MKEQKEVRESTKPKIGTREYLNKRCWLARNLKISPAQRCWYCVLTFRGCPLVPYLFLSLVFILGSLGILLITEGKISRPVVAIVLTIVFGYGYFSNRITERLIKANFLERKL